MKTETRVGSCAVTFFQSPDTAALHSTRDSLRQHAISMLETCLSPHGAQDLVVTG